MANSSEQPVCGPPGEIAGICRWRLWDAAAPPKQTRTHTHSLINVIHYLVADDGGVLVLDIIYFQFESAIISGR